MDFKLENTTRIMDKFCRKCGTFKPETEFRRRTDKGGYQAYCIECAKKLSAKHYENNKQRVIDLARKNTRRYRLNLRRKILQYFRENPCRDCSETDPVVLDFHHRDPSIKVMEVSNMVRAGYSWKKIKPEIDKCDVLCANCHRRVTAKQRGWYSDLGSEDDSKDAGPLILENEEAP